MLMLRTALFRHDRTFLERAKCLHDIWHMVCERKWHHCWKTACWMKFNDVKKKSVFWFCHRLHPWWILKWFAVEALIKDLIARDARHFSTCRSKKENSHQFNHLFDRMFCCLCSKVRQCTSIEYQDFETAGLMITVVVRGLFLTFFALHHKGKRSFLYTSLSKRDVTYVMILFQWSQ